MAHVGSRGKRLGVGEVKGVGVGLVCEGRRGWGGEGGGWGVYSGRCVDKAEEAKLHIAENVNDCSTCT